MQAKNDSICPWCQTEIVWDPEIGPEDSCPHCFNDLGEYRSIHLKVKQTGQQIVFDEDEEDESDFADDEVFTYEENVQLLLDRQEETPECPSCHQFMLFAGEQGISGDSFKPAVRELLPRPIVQPPFRVKMFVCPSCFRVDTILSEEDRTAMIDMLKQKID
jgi:Zn-finger nucleic acid-binding protein